MDPQDNEQTEILRGIWNEMKALGKNLGSRIDRTNERLEAVRVELGQSIDALGGEVAGLRVEVSELRRGFQLLDARFEHFLTGKHGQEHAEIRERLACVEDRLTSGGR